MVVGNIATYNRKRNFRVTPEPAGKSTGTRGAGRFVVQKHAARRLHYDFRLEWEGVLRSWAVPKGPSLDPAVKRMAVQVEDHPVSYGDFEGVIPPGEYGAGTVIVWDRGQWQPVGDAAKGFREGKIKFTLEGEKLRGGFTLVRMRGRDDERQPSWLLIKEKDEFARPAAEFDVVEALGDSVITGKKKPARKPAAKRAGAALPPLLAPQLATLVTAPPAGGEWQYELKLDGYRMLTRVDGSDVRCYTRNGNDWSSRLPRIVQAVRELKLPSCWLDGEVVALDEEGVPHFQMLQNAFDRGSTAELRYIVFDLLFADGEDLRELPQTDRRERLRRMLPERRGALVRFSATLEGAPARLLAASRAAGFEGLIGKRADAPYRSGRSRDWIKLKNGQRQEFVIGGFTDPQGSRTGLGSLLLGVHDASGALRYAGNVGTGFDEKTLAALHQKLVRLETAASPFENGPQKVGTTRRAVPHWVKPRLVAEISFAGWTAGKHVRQGVFQGLREDKPPEQITVEQAKAPSAVKGTQKRKAVSRAVKLPDMRITHPERVIDSQSGVTKGELVAYYAQVASLMLPHLADRPVAMLRAPSGVTGAMFFQKHAEARTLPHVDRLPPSLDPDHGALLAISSEQGLLSAAQMNVIELHTWNATRHAIEKPDRIVFDLDPGSGVSWQQVKEAAVLLRALLDELELKSCLKTSGGKGLHVVLPLKPALGWDEVKQFTGDVVRHLARVIPQRFVAKSGPTNRVGRIFVDYLRNGRGATTAAAWSARARPGMGVSVPIGWDELAGLAGPTEWSVSSFEERLAIGNKPWKAYERSRQGLTKAVKALQSIGKVPRK
ncbi:MAG: DNA ligase D [Pseudomonadota bacterium]|nr:DNA ligase D [Pseudomonadota bacterium]